LFPGDKYKSNIGLLCTTRYYTVLIATTVARDFVTPHQRILYQHPDPITPKRKPVAPVFPALIAMDDFKPDAGQHATKGDVITCGTLDVDTGILKESYELPSMEGNEESKETIAARRGDVSAFRACS
jgi:hypothetical protein